MAHKESFPDVSAFGFRQHGAVDGKKQIAVRHQYLGGFTHGFMTGASMWNRIDKTGGIKVVDILVDVLFGYSQLSAHFLDVYLERDRAGNQPEDLFQHGNVDLFHIGCDSHFFI